VKKLTNQAVVLLRSRRV